MIEIINNLFIGDQNDYELNVKYKNDFYVVHACKDPYHRIALGYSGRGVPKNHPEYLIARRQNRLICNLIDPDTMEYIPKEIIAEVLKFISDNIGYHKILVHCNQGGSRSAVIGMLYLKEINFFGKLTFEESELIYSIIYPYYNPSKGMRDFAEYYWSHKLLF